MPIHSDESDTVSGETVMTLTSGGAAAAGDAFPLSQAANNANDKTSSGADEGADMPCTEVLIISGAALAGQSITERPHASCQPFLDFCEPQNTRPLEERRTLARVGRIRRGDQLWLKLIGIARW